MDMQSLVLVRIRMTPLSPWCSPYEIVFGRPPPLIREVKRNLLQREEMEVLQQLEQLGKVICDITLYIKKNTIFSRHYCIPILTGRFSMGKGLEATDAVPAHLERAIHNCTNHSHCS